MEQKNKNSHVTAYPTSTGYPQMASPTSQKVGKWLEKFSIYIFSAVLSLGGFFYTKMDNKLEVLEERVAILFQQKVSREELRDEMSLLRSSQNQMKDDINKSQSQMREDIIQRLDLIMRMLPSKQYPLP